jgi:hypothetical protein
MKQYVNISLIVFVNMLVLANNCCFLDTLLLLRIVILLIRFICTLAKLCKASNDQVPNLLLIGVAGNKKHISSDSFHQHLIPSNAIITKRQEDPRDIRLNCYIHWILLVIFAKLVKQIKDTLFDQDFN